jgi:hypothetical protein
MFARPSHRRADYQAEKEELESQGDHAARLTHVREFREAANAIVAAKQVFIA